MISKTNQNTSIWIAYSRGNDHLTLSNGRDIGSRNLYGGPVMEYEEPFRSAQLLKYESPIPFNKDMHIYTVKWEPGIILNILNIVMVPPFIYFR